MSIDWGVLQQKFWTWVDAHFPSPVVESAGGAVLLLVNVAIVYLLPHWLAAGVNATLWCLFYEIFVDKNPVGKVADVTIRELIIGAGTFVLYLFR